MRLKIVAVVGLTLLSLGCRLFDDPNAVGLSDTSDAADAAPVTDTNTPDMSLPDVSPSDLPMVSDLPDMSTLDMTYDAGADSGGDHIDINPFTLLEVIRNEVCAYYARQDYHGTVFFGVGFRTEAGCQDFFDVFLRNVLGVLARDAHFERARINEDAVLEIIDHVRNYNGDPRVFPITDVAGIVTPLSGVGGPCSSNFACESSAARPTQCYLENAQDCDGECAETWRICNGMLCETDERCSQGTCVQLLPDGDPCSDDTACENQCLTDMCGTLDVDDDCTDNPNDCGAGAYCRTDVMPRLCALLGILNDPCSEDTGCQVGHYCDETTSLCQTIAEGTPCRVDACSASLNCVQVSAQDTDERCYAPRPSGEYCTSDSHCEAGTYCNVNVCTAAKQATLPCRKDRECESICRFPDGDTMIGECAQFEWGLPANATCHVAAALCGMPFECETIGNTFTGVCRTPAPLNLNDPCDATRPFWCPDGSTCRAGTCQPISPAGAPCTTNDECKSGLCLMESCFDRVEACTADLMD